MRQSTAARVLNVADVESDIAEILANNPFLQAADSGRITIPVLEYVEHRDGVSEVGKLSAEAVAREFETAAKEVEAMGAELVDAAKRCEATVAGAHAAAAECKEVAASIRESGKLYFLRIEDVALMTAEVRAACTEIKEKIAGQVT